MKFTTPEAIRLALLSRREIALFDLRGEAAFATGHPLFAANLPLGHLEQRILFLVPRKETPVVVYDDGEGYAVPAFDRLTAIGYTDVSVMKGGLSAWKGAGYELFEDVNSASKAFGELVEARRHTPSVSPQDARALIESDADLVVLDVRRFDEYQRMSIPHGISVPGAELVLRARTIAPDPATTIIVNCAGRTRGLIGTQSLINAGLPNRVMALRNGTIGWTLAGQELNHGRTESFPDVGKKEREDARAAAQAVSYRAGVKRLSPQQLDTLKDDRSRTLYLFDVRTAEEYRKGHIEGFVNIAGGQLVQETDMYAPVRGARIVLADDIGPRADMSASWLAQMGWDAYVLEGGFDGELATGEHEAPRTPAPKAPTITAAELHDMAGDAACGVVDVSLSTSYSEGHIPDAMFAMRSRLPDAVAALDRFGRIVVTSEDGYTARFAAIELQPLVNAEVLALDGGNGAWRSEGLAWVAGAGHRLTAADDRYRRPYEGTDNPVEAMQAYLDWEFGLVAQLERDGTHGFFVI